MNLGISPTMLMPESFESAKVHLQAVRMGCSLSDYTALDLYLAEDDAVAKEEVKELKNSGKSINYNSPAQFQCFGTYNAGSFDATERQNAYDLAKKHLDYAAEIGSRLFVVTSCPDVPEQRAAVLDYFAQFLEKVCAYAKQREIQVLIEPIERHRFKKLLLGPTENVAAFIRELQGRGYDNLGIMVDFGHLPLMEEDCASVLNASMPVGLHHAHFGDAILEPSHVLYGHMHPPMCERQGCYSMDDITMQFAQLLRCGYLGDKGAKKPLVSLEVRPYSGVSPVTSARVHFERMSAAFRGALEMIRSENT